MKNPQQLVQKLWNFCSILRDDGLSYSDYVEQLTYLLFMKMAEEHSKPPFLYLDPLPRGYDWASLFLKQGEDLLEHYERILRRLGQRKDLFGGIYKHALSKFRDPEKFEKLIHEINQLEWSKFDTDVKGDAYEGLLERTASEGKAGAGQYFTPRALVEAIVEVMAPACDETICDPACGTGGFLLIANRFMSAPVSRRTKKSREWQSTSAFHGVELVDSVARLCLMNMVLHGIGGQSSPVSVRDALEKPSEQQFDIVLTNPPFGRRSSVTITADDGSDEREQLSIVRSDFWATTSNKQLNFVQHVFTLLKPTGRAAVVVPDNVLFEGGAGEIVRRELLEKTSVHTLLRLPTGIFYAEGVKANVLFFDRRPANAASAREKLWIYDLRTNKHFTLVENPLRETDLRDFVRCYNVDDRSKRKPTARFKAFSYDELVKRDKANLDITWLRDETLEDFQNLPPPDVIFRDIASELGAALEQFRELDPNIKA